MAQANSDRLLRYEKLLRLYRSEPELYAETVLGVTWWEKQVEIARIVSEAKAQRGNNRVKIAVRASHGVGKSKVVAGIVNWHFDMFRPSITLTTAPTAAQVDDVLWKEVRIDRGGRPGLFPSASRMETGDDHFAVGYTARNADSFQGRHEVDGIMAFDEAVGVESQFFDAAEGITSGGCWVWLCIYNPTDTSSRMYAEELSGEWKIVVISALDHPNVIAGLRGEPEPYPGAVSLGWVSERLERWCDYLGQNAVHLPTDIEFPPGSGRWWRPGPLFESRVLGRWPSQGFDTVWSEAVWNLTVTNWHEVPQEPLVLGCDVARFGDDWTVIHARRGAVSLLHERHNGWGTDQTAGRLKQIAASLCQMGEDPQQVQILIDDDGVGGGVVDKAEGWNFIGISASERALEPEDYPNRRSELWFSTRDRAADGRLDLSRLSEEHQNLLRSQFLSCKWKIDSQGRRVVEPKDDMKRRLRKSDMQLKGGSPDDADAVNLAYCGLEGRVRTGGSIGHVPHTSMTTMPGGLKYSPDGLARRDGPFDGLDNPISDYDPFR